MTPDRPNEPHAIGLWPPTWPMGLTMLRLMLLPVFLWVLLYEAHSDAGERRWIAVVIFAIMAVTDKLDGYLARRLNQTSKLGTVLDPVADKLLVGCSVILLSFDGMAPRGFVIPTYVVIAVYGKDLLTVVGVTLLLAIVGKVVIAPRWLGKVSTVLQLSMVMAVLLAPPPASSSHEGWLLLVRVLWWAVTAVAVASAVDYISCGVRQFRESRGKPAAGL